MNSSMNSSMNSRMNSRMNSSMNISMNSSMNSSVNNNNKYSAILWDLDGTLLNTLEDITDSTNFALKSFGYPEKTLEQIKSYVGNGILREMELAVPGGQGNPQFADVYKVFREHYVSNCGNKTAPYPGIQETLQALKSRGYKMAVVSNKSDPEAKLLVAQHFKGTLNVVYGESKGVRKKPAPDTVFAALKQLECKPEEALFIGDSDVDINTAINAGVDCVSASWGFRSREFLIESGAKTIIDSPGELLRVLQELKRD